MFPFCNSRRVVADLKRALYNVAPMTIQRWLALGGGLYLLLMAVVVIVLLDARRRAVTVYASPDEQARWEDFGDAMREKHHEREALREQLSQHSGQPVAASPPKTRSQRPPTLELLENHFAACLSISLAGVTLLFALMWGLLMGAMLRPGRTHEDSPECGSASAAAN